MQVSVETTQGLERRLTITVPAETVDSEVAKRLKKVAKTRRIDGFRPGKAPIKIIQQHFGMAVKAEVADELMERNYIEALISEQIQPAGSPQFALSGQFGGGEDLVFTATFEVYPEIGVQNLEAIKIEKKLAEVQESDVDNMLMKLRKQHGVWEEKQDVCNKDDRIIIDFKGSVDGEEFEGGQAQDFELVLGQGQMIPGFEEGILEKKASEETFTIDVTFPEDYPEKTLAGKEAQFEITLKKVEALALPEMDTEFVKKFGIADGDADKLRAEIRKNMERELSQSLRNHLKTQVLDGLVDQNPIDVPNALITRHIADLKEQAKERFGQIKTQDLPDELFKDQALRRARLSLLLSQFVTDQKIEANDERVQSLITTIASAYEQPEQVIEHYNSDEKLLNQMKDLAIEEQAIDQIMEKAQVTTIDATFEEIVNT